MVDESNSSSGAISSTRINSTSENEQNQVIDKLKSRVKIFRNGNSTKMNTITSILTILGKDTNVSITQSQKEVTFDPYLTYILSIQSTLNKSREISTQSTLN